MKVNIVSAHKIDVRSHSVIECNSHHSNYYLCTQAIAQNQRQGWYITPYYITTQNKDDLQTLSKWTQKFKTSSRLQQSL